MSNEKEMPIKKIVVEKETVDRVAKELGKK